MNPHDVQQIIDALHSMQGELGIIAGALFTIAFISLFRR